VYYVETAGHLSIVYYVETAGHLSIVYYVETACHLSHGVTAHYTHGTKDCIGFRTSLDSETKWTIFTPAGYIEP
jgi:hypothetical protein